MSPLLQDGFELTLIGMGVVFVLLTLLVGIIRGMSALSQWIEQTMPAPAAAAAPAPRRVGHPAEHELVGVISAAIAAHRRKR